MPTKVRQLTHVMRRPNIATAALLLAAIGFVSVARAAPEDPPGPGQPILSANALTTTPVGGLEKTAATTSVVPVSGEPFASALRVTIRGASAETNATQLTMPIAAPLAKGDALLATVYVRGAATGHRAPGQIQLLLEQATSPWTKSLTEGVVTTGDPRQWKRVVVPFTALDSYKPGDAMVSLRFAYGPQTVEVGGLSVVSYGKAIPAERLVDFAARQNPLGNASVSVNRGAQKQTILGFGGDFCQPRYGATTPMDAVGAYNLAHLHVAQARMGIPLNNWTPAKGVYKDTAQAHAAFLQLQLLARRHIPIIGTVWEGPQWLLGGAPEQSGRTLAPEKYADCADAIAQFLVVARDRYGVTVPYLSFNEPDYGVNFLFKPEQMANFIAVAGPRFRALGLPTRFLVGDTTGGSPVVDYARPLLANRRLATYLGPIAFHCWDVLDSSDERYAQIAALARQYHKPVWCTEAGFDSALWQRPNPFEGWENALKTAVAYVRTLRSSGASAMDYWTYQDNYPIVSRDGRSPFPIFSVLQQLERALPSGSTVVSATSHSDGLDALATVGPRPGQFAVVLTNTVGAGNVAISGLPAGARVSVTVQTAAKPQLRPLSVNRAGRVVVPVPARSVVIVLALPGAAR